MAPTEQDMNEWIRALRLHQIDLFRSRSSIFEQWLSRQGVRVARNTIKSATAQFVEDMQEEGTVDSQLNQAAAQKLL